MKRSDSDDPHDTGERRRITDEDMKTFNEERMIDRVLNWILIFLAASLGGGMVFLAVKQAAGS